MKALSLPSTPYGNNREEEQRQKNHTPGEVAGREGDWEGKVVTVQSRVVPFGGEWSVNKRAAGSGAHMGEAEDILTTNTKVNVTDEATEKKQKTDR